jgi:glycyl-tRNA synthetase beta chain
MDRELLLEIGCEELPASWLPGLTTRVGEVVAEQLAAARLTPEAPVETYSTPRRLTVRIGRLSERQTDLEELVNGPPVSASFLADGSPTPAAAGFAAKNGATVATLERVETAKGLYLAFRKRQRGKAAVDVLPTVLGGTLRGLSFPKQMHWDAMLEDGKGELVFGRPIRWLLFLYGGRVVPFAIARTPGAQGGSVQDVATGAVTYGHRFLTTSGRAGRSIKVRSFDEYRSKLLENFVILERSERHNKIARELDAKAQRLQGRVSRTVRAESSLLEEVPDLVEYPSVVAGTFGPEFLELPEEVLTTTLVHHQHYFPVEGEDGHLKNAFLAVTNTEPDNERTIARNAERVVTARLRDARFFWEADRKVALEPRLDRLGTLLFHKKLGSYREKAERIERLAREIAQTHFRASAEAAEQAARAARWAKVDLTTDMVREFTELQGTMGGIYAREEGQPEEIWKAIYFHYLPVATEADAPPTRAQLGKAGATWAAVALADKLDTIVGLFAAGEKPTGSRDPYGLRRAGNGVIRILVDLPALTGLSVRPALGALMAAARKGHPTAAPATDALASAFMIERLQAMLEQRGFSSREARAATAGDGRGAAGSPLEAIWRADALREMRQSQEFLQLAALFKRARNIVTDRFGGAADRAKWGLHRDRLTEPAELTLRQEIDRRGDEIAAALAKADYKKAVVASAGLAPAVDQMFKDVFVMAEEPALRDARLSLLLELRDRILDIADISELAAES